MNEIIKQLGYLVSEYVNSDTNMCLSYPFIDNDGYGVIQKRVNGINLHIRAHRLVYQIANNCVLQQEELILHKCDNPSCCNPKHLFKGTHNDNVQDKVNKGRQAKGKKNAKYKNGYYSIYEPVDKPPIPFEKLHNRGLTVDQVILIKKEIEKKQNESLIDLSIRLNIKYQTIKDIYYGRTYNNVTI